MTFWQPREEINIGTILYLLIESISFFWRLLGLILKLESRFKVLFCLAKQY